MAVTDEFGFYREQFLLRDLEQEIARSTRYEHEFAVVMLSPGRSKYEFSHSQREMKAKKALVMNLLQTRRAGIDRAYYYNGRLVLLLPESGQASVDGFARRLRKLAAAAIRDDGFIEPVALHFGATLFPSRATTARSLLQRATVSMQIAIHDHETIHIDSAKATEQPQPEHMRRASPS